MPLLAIDCEIYHISLAAEAVAQGHSQPFFVLDQQDALVDFRATTSCPGALDATGRLASLALGRCKVKTLPGAKFTLHCESPPIASAMLLARGSPNPVP